MGTKQDVTCKTKLKMLSLEDTQNYEALFEMRVSAFWLSGLPSCSEEGARSSPRFSQRAGNTTQ